MYKWFRDDSQVLYLASELENYNFNTGLFLKRPLILLEFFRAIGNQTGWKKVVERKLKTNCRLDQKYQDHV